MTARRALAIATFFAGAAAFTGCGAAPSARAPSRAADEPAPKNAVEAEEQLNTNRTRVNANAPARNNDPRNEGAKTEQREPPKDPKAPSPPPPPSADDGAKKESPRKPADKGKLEDEDRSREEAQSPCVIACRAYKAMQRAAEVICREVGEENDRCKSARDAVKDAADRVSSCGCG